MKRQSSKRKKRISKKTFSKQNVVSLPEYKGDLSKIFDFKHPISMDEAYKLTKRGS